MLSRRTAAVEYGIKAALKAIAGRGLPGDLAGVDFPLCEVRRLSSSRFSLQHRARELCSASYSVWEGIKLLQSSQRHKAATHSSVGCVDIQPNICQRSKIEAAAVLQHVRIHCRRSRDKSAHLMSTGWVLLASSLVLTPGTGPSQYFEEREINC